VLWKKTAIALVVIVATCFILVVIKVHYIREQCNGSILWNGKEAYVFVGVVQYGYAFSYLELAVEGVREAFPFGASTQADKHHYLVVLHITPDSIEHYSVDNFYLGSPPVPLGENIYATNLLDAQPQTLKWGGGNFAPATPADLAELRDIGTGTIATTPSYDNIAGWSRRLIGGEVLRESAGSGLIEKDSNLTIQLDGKPFVFAMNSGYASHDAYVDLTRPGHPQERIWSLDLKSKRVNTAVYNRTFDTGLTAQRL
jgi:hypothetical protein